MTRRNLHPSLWLDAHTDRNAGLFTLPRNVILSDITGSGDHYLILTDLKLEQNTNSRLKFYKGTTICNDQSLPNAPNSIVTFYPDHKDSSLPVIGVACGSDLFFYKNLKPFYKLCLPMTPITQEDDLWTKVNCKDHHVDANHSNNKLRNLPYSTLSQSSEECTEEKLKKNLLKEDIITCMTTIKKNTKDNCAVSCPIIGTESGNIYIINPEKFSILHQANTCTVTLVPFIIKSCGLYDVEFTIVIATREKYICMIRKGWLEGKLLIQVKSDIVDMILIPDSDNFIIVATTDQELQSYNNLGQRLWIASIKMPATCLCVVPLTRINSFLVAVGLKGGLVHFYQGKQIVDSFTVIDSPSVITFGQAGLEDNGMVIVTISGTLMFKILKRVAEISVKNQCTVTTVQKKPLPLPKKSKLFLEQSMREMEAADDIHKKFQQELLRLRISTAKATVTNIKCLSGIGSQAEDLKLSAQILSLGRKITVLVNIENISAETALMELILTIHFNPEFYTVTNYSSEIPAIPPLLSYKLVTKIEENLKDLHDISNTSSPESNNMKDFRIFISRRNIKRPLLAAIITLSTEFID